jgi:hypothetical protein
VCLHFLPSQCCCWRWQLLHYRPDAHRVRIPCWLCEANRKMPTIFGKPRVYAIWHFGDVMAALPRTRPPLQRPDRRSFLWSLASLGFPSRIPRPEKQSEQVYRFLTPVCEVRMSVQYFASSSTNSFRFRDDPQPWGWLKGFVKNVPIEFVAAKEPFWT